MYSINIYSVFILRNSIAEEDENFSFGAMMSWVWIFQFPHCCCLALEKAPDLTKTTFLYDKGDKIVVKKICQAPNSWFLAHNS